MDTRSGRQGAGIKHEDTRSGINEPHPPLVAESQAMTVETRWRQGLSRWWGGRPHVAWETTIEPSLLNGIVLFALF